MTTSYKHRFAREFHRISRDHPTVPLQERFSMATLQLRESRLTELIAQLQSYQRSSDSNLGATPTGSEGVTYSGLAGSPADIELRSSDRLLAGPPGPVPASPGIWVQPERSIAD